MVCIVEGGGIIIIYWYVGRMWVGFCNGCGGGSGSDEIEGYYWLWWCFSDWFFSVEVC